MVAGQATTCRDLLAPCSHAIIVKHSMEAYDRRIGRFRSAGGVPVTEAIEISETSRDAVGQAHCS
jgi:hypothetical protein